MNKKKDVLKYREISLYFLFTSIIISILGTILSNIIIVSIGVVLLLVYIIISFIFWKCPFCRKRLPMKFNIKNVDEVICPYCDANLLYKRKSE